MEKSSSNDYVVMICLVTPEGKPIRSPHDVIVYHPNTKANLFKATSDGSGKVLVPQLDGIDANQVVSVDVRQAKTDKLITTHRVLYENIPGLMREQITLYPKKKPFVTPPSPKPLQINQITYQWRQSIRKRIASKLGAVRKIQVPKQVSEAIYDLNNAYQLAQRIFAGDLNAAQPFLKLTGHRHHTSAFFAAGFGLGASGFSLHNIPGLPCVFQDGGALDVAFAGLLLDVHRAETLGDLTQPGAYTEQGALFLHDRHHSLQVFAGAVVDLSEGHISPEAYHSQLFGDGTDAVPLPDELGPSPDQPGHGSGILPPPTPNRFQPGMPQDFGRDIPCDLMWVDCVDEIVQAATNYTPPIRCSEEETIGSLTPNAVCRGKENVDIEIRPVTGQSFSGDATKCKVLLQQLGANLNVILENTKLSIQSYSSNLVKVRLAKAERSGCIGFRGTSGGVQANIGFLNSCFKLGRIHNVPLSRLLTPGFGGLRNIQCTGRNQLSILSEPILDAVTLNGENDNAHIVTGNAVTLIEEACTDVEIGWRFVFDDPNVNPADFIRVSVHQGSTVIASDLGADDNLTVTEQDSQTYTLKAAAIIGQETCGESEITVQIDRYDALHLQGSDRLQTGQIETITVRSSCPAPAGGIAVQLTASDTTLLDVPANVIIAAGQTMATFDVQGKGDRCAAVTITATAASHLAANHSFEVYSAPHLDTLSQQQVRTCDTINLTILGSCFKEGETAVNAVGDGVLVSLPIIEFSATQLVVEVSDLDVGDWRIEVFSRGLVSNNLTLEVTPSPVIIEDFQAEVVDSPVNDSTTIVPCFDNWTAVSWRLRNCSRVEIRENNVLIHEEDLSGCGGPFEGLFTRIVQAETNYRLTAFPVGGGGPQNRSIALGTAGIKKLTLNNESDKDLVIWVYDGHIVNTDDIPLDSPKHDLDAGDSLELSFSDCDFKDISGVDKDAAEDENKDPYGNAVTVNHLVVFNVWDIIGADEGIETSVDIYV